MRRIIAMLLAIVMLVGNVPVQTFATEEQQETIACPVEGCEFTAGHDGNCSNYEACQTEGCEYAAGHDGNCSNYEACQTEGCEYAAGHDGNCSNYEACQTEGCEYAAGHEGDCSNAIMVVEEDVIPVSITASFTAQEAGEFLAPPQIDMLVSSDTAESYGFHDQTDKAAEVSAIDVLVAAHVAKYGDGFTKETATDYLKVSGNFITMMFESNGKGSSDTTGNFCILVNGKQPGNNGIEQAVVATGDLVEIFVYQDLEGNWEVGDLYTDKYVWLELPDATRLDDQSVYAGRGAQLVAKGYAPFHSYAGIVESTVAGAAIYLVDIETGELTALDATTGADGSVTVTVPEAYAGQTVYLTAKGSEMAMTLAKVTVEAPPVNDTCKLTSLEIAVGTKTFDESMVKALSPVFSSDVTAYSTEKLDYIGSSSRNYVWIKASAGEGATVTAENGRSGVTAVPNGEWIYLEYVYATLMGSYYYGTLSDGQFNKVTITVSTADGSRKEYIVTIPVEVDLSKSKLEWKTDLASSVYYTKDTAAPNALRVEANYISRPLEDQTEITYQWYANTTASTEGGTAIVGAVNAAFTPSVAVLGKFYYYAVASCGELRLTSTVTEVTVNEEAAPKSVSIVCDYPYTIPTEGTNALGGVKYVANVGDILKLKAVDENGKETPVTWVTTLNGNLFDEETGIFTVKETSFSYFQAESLYDANVKSEEKYIEVDDYCISTSYKNPSVTLSKDGQSAVESRTAGGIEGYTIWKYSIVPENAATLRKGVEEKALWLSFNALRPGTIEVSFDLDLDGDGVGDGNGLTDTATLTINGIAVEDAAGKLTKTYLEKSAANPDPTVQLKAISSTENPAFTWESADETIATVDANGLVTAQGVGSVIISAKDGTYTGGIKVVVADAENPAFEQIDFTTVSPYAEGLNGQTWKTANFKPTTLAYSGLKMTKATAGKLTLKNTTAYNAEKYTAVATYTGASGTAQSIAINSDAATELMDIPFDTNTITITLTDKEDETRKTVYTFEVTRPRDTDKAVAQSGIVLNPVGRELSTAQYNGKAEGFVFRANEQGEWNGTAYTVITSHYSYRTWAQSALEAFTLTVKGNTDYSHVRYSTDEGTTWTYLGQPAKTGKVTGEIRFPAREENGENPVVKVQIQFLDDKTYTANVKAGKDGFAEGTPKTYTVWAEQLPVFSEECDILMATTNSGDWYPAFHKDITGYRILVANGAEAPELTFTVSEDAVVTVDGAAATPVNGQYSLVLGNSHTIHVKSSSGNVEKTYTIGYSQKSAADVPDSVVDFLCVNSQYTNGKANGYGISPQKILTDSDVLSLGNFGGYVTAYYENGLTDNPNNAYGVDFYVDGNAFMDTTTGSGLGSMEPGQVWVSEDGSTWYALAGSEHYEADTIWNYSVTYEKTEAGSTVWSDNQGNTMASTHGRAFEWPRADMYPMNDLATRDSFTLSGVLLPSNKGTITGNDDFYSLSSGARFGYVDVLVNGRANPYLTNKNYENESSGFDLAWAVDAAGNPVDVSGKSFHYVKVVTASNIIAGAANEKSTEVGSIVRASARAEAVGVTAAPAGVTFTNGDNSYTYDFAEKQQIFEISLPRGMTSATVQLNGTADGDNIYINNQRVASGTASAAFTFSAESQKLIRIIVQNGEKEPVIYLLKVKVSDLPALSALKFSASTSATSAVYELQPAFDSQVRNYKLIVPDSVTSVSVWAKLGENETGKINAVYTNTSNKETAKSVTSGAAKGVSLSSILKTGFGGNSLTIKVGEHEAYKITVVRRATLSKLSLEHGEGNTAVLDPTFKGDKTEYSTRIPKDAVVSVKATVKTRGAAVTINGAQGTAVTPAWSGLHSEIKLVVSGGADNPDVVPTTYKIRLVQCAESLEILTPPTRTEYAAGEKFDPAGMLLKATYSDGSTESVGADRFTYPEDVLAPNTTEIEISFDGLTVRQPITMPVVFAGSGSQEDPYQIKTKEDLVKLSGLVADGLSFEGEYFKMLNDITLPDTEGEDVWVPIGINKSKPFSGNFDGGSKLLTIPEGGLPLIGFPAKASVSNLNIYGTRIAGFGVVNGYAQGYDNVPAITIDNVTLKAGTKTLKAGFIGGYASGTNTIVIKNSTVEKGVIIGYDKQQKWVGSFGGEFNGTIENCVSHADVYGVDFVGGIVADKGQSMGDFVVTDCEFDGTVTGTGNYVGGIVGYGYAGTGWGTNTSPNAPGVTIENCISSGTVTGADYVGGILGSESPIAQAWENGIGYIRNNRFTGTVKATAGNHIGGVIGYIRSLNKYNVISGNYYAMDCGADQGIGGVEFVDTNCATHETASGVTYLNTETSVAECPKISGCAWKVAHNRTDDPLGADKTKLCYTDTDRDPIATELKVSGTYKTEYLAGDNLDLTGIILTVHYNWGDPKTIEQKEVTVTGYEKDRIGEQTVTLSYQGLTAEIKVQVKAKPAKLTVSVTILGDSHHGEISEPHGLARGGLTTWAAATVEATANETVWDVLQRAAQQNGISISAGNTQHGIYISAVNGLAEFSNGSKSGWMYTVNGSHPNVSVGSRYVKHGDVIVLHYTDNYDYEEGGVNYGKPIVNAGYVDQLISEIGKVEYTNACKQKIDAARKAYNSLTVAEKNKVTKLSILTKAENDYDALKKKYDQAKADEVKKLINNIGTVTINSDSKINTAWNAYNALTADQKKLVTNVSVLQSATKTWNQLEADAVKALIDQIPATVTDNTRESVKKARDAYDKLTADQKKLVSNYKKLTDAEATLAKLNASEEDKTKAQKVMDLISRLDEITLDSEQDIMAARKAYDALNDLQKKMVENYSLLVAAEKKLAQLKLMSKVDDPYNSTGAYMEGLGTPGVASVGGEWMVIGLARSGRDVPNVEDYYAAVVRYVQENIDESQRLHRAKSSDNSRVILALTAIGEDVTDVDGHNLLKGLNNMDYIQKQGINGPIWALIAFDSGNYPVPAGDVSREKLVSVILEAQLADGGWALSGEHADPDMTGMAIQALAAYADSDLAVEEAVERAVWTLSGMQNEDGSFSSVDGASCESIAQVIVALSALGIDAGTDARFVKNRISALDALLTYYVPGGGFRHVLEGNLDGMATEQAYYALVAYNRMKQNKNFLYDMTDVIDMGGDVVAETTAEAETIELPAEPVADEEAHDGSNVVIWIGVTTLSAAAIVAILLIRKKPYGKFL